MNSKKFAVGIDLGGTFVKYALVAETGEILFDGKLPVGGKAKREDILDAVSLSIQKVIDFADAIPVQITGIGIGSPGIVCDGIVQGGADNLDRWANINISEIYSKAFNLPVLVDNDANVMGLGEAVYGAAKECTDVIFITVGTGIGGAIVANGELYGGYKNRGTEMGHVTIAFDGIDCNCGGRGCLEAYASTSALIQQFADATGLDAENVNGHFVVEKFLAGEPAAVACMEKHTYYLGHGIAGFINTFAPQKVVIGGGISEAGQFYIDMIKKTALRLAMPDCAVNTDVVGAKLGNNAGCLGAASLIFKKIK
jgi:glucokinase